MVGPFGSHHDGPGLSLRTVSPRAPERQSPACRAAAASCRPFASMTRSTSVSQSERAILGSTSVLRFAGSGGDRQGVP